MRIPVKQYVALLAKYLRPQRAKVIVVAVVLFFQIAVQLANPQVLRAFIDSAAAGGSAQTLAAIAALFIAIALAQQALVLTGTYLSQDVGWTATNVLRTELAEHCLSLDMSFHKTHTPGEWIERIDGDVSSLANFFSQFVMLVLGNALLLGAVLVVTWFEDWRIGLALGAFVVCAFAALNRTRHFTLPLFVASRQSEALLYGELEEHLSGLDDIRANGAGDYAARRFAERQRGAYRTAVRAELSSAVIDMVTTSAFAIGYIGALALGAWLFQSGLISLGTIFLVVRYAQMLRDPLSQITRQLQDLQKASAGIVRISQLLALRPQVTGGEGVLPVGSALSVEFEDVTFVYADTPAGPVHSAERAAGGSARSPATGVPATRHATSNGGQHSAAARAAALHPLNGSHQPDQIVLPDDALARAAAPQRVVDSGLSDERSEDIDERVLRRLNFTLAPGRVLGLLGRTGSGKTTVARLLARLYDPTGGAIRLGGVDIRGVQTRELRRAVGMVTQDVQMFSATLRQNLTLFDDAIPDQRIHAALAQLGLEEWYGALPAGLDTVLTSGLSAGEAQLLAFTRVMLRDPALVILDEASSRLDPATERLIERAVDGLLAGRTAIIIAHRLGTVQRAGEILILEDGQIREQGQRAALAADPGSRFARLLQTGLDEVLV